MSSKTELLNQIDQLKKRVASLEQINKQMNRMLAEEKIKCGNLQDAQIKNKEIIKQLSKPKWYEFWK
ncbi:MAG: hypothetical protein ABFC18_03160 [Rikenellaceae bacterium]